MLRLKKEIQRYYETKKTNPTIIRINPELLLQFKTKGLLKLTDKAPHRLTLYGMVVKLDEEIEQFRLE